MVLNVTCLQRLMDLHLQITIAAHRSKGRAARDYPSVLDNLSPSTIAFHTRSCVSSAAIGTH